MLRGNCEEVIKVKAPAKSDIWIIRSLIMMGLLAMLLFVYWFVDKDHIGYAPVFWLLTFALLFKLVKMIHEWYHYWSPGVPQMPASSRTWSVDVLTTSCPGEPRDMIIRTLRAMVNIRYPHTNYLCDEGDDPVLKKICGELGVIHVTRTIKVDAKAGNINNALKQATGEICVVLDPDHEPVPEFLDRVLPYFENQEIGFVQCVQAYGNQEESFIARGAAEQTYHFYGPMMMCMNTYGTVQAIGANCTFRRKALDSIGGHAAGLSEDMHTAMQLHAKGWKSVYVPEILTRGLVPATLSSYYKQQLKWSRGTFELLFRTYPKLKKNFTWRQKIHYFTIPLYFLFGLINLIDIAIPLLALSMAEVPWEVNLSHFALYFLPLCGISIVTRLYAQRWLLEKHERGFHFAGGILRMATWWIFLVGFVYTIFKIKVPYIPTPKEDAHQNFVRLSIPNVITLLLSLALVYYGLSIDWTPYSIAMASYSLMTVAMLGFTIVMSQQKFLIQLKALSKKIPVFSFFAGGALRLVGRTQQVAYQSLRNGPLLVLLAISMLFLSYSSIDDVLESEVAFAEKELGGFYLGTAFPNQNDADVTTIIENSAFTNLNLVSFDQEFAGRNNWYEPDKLKQVRSLGALPFLKWTTSSVADSSREKLYLDIKAGRYDARLQHSADFFRSYKSPVFISFLGNNTDRHAGEFREAWQYLYTFFNNLGISNLTWVWCPAEASAEKFYPGEKFVDWLGVSCLNYAVDPQINDYYSFSEIYTPYRKAYGKFQKPVMITALGSASGPNQQQWLSSAFADITRNFEEVKAAVVFTQKVMVSASLPQGGTKAYRFDFGLSQPETVAAVTEVLVEEGIDIQLFSDVNVFRNPASDYTSPFIKGSPGHFTLVAQEQPFYMRGVAYNTAHDWRDGNMPLSRRQLEDDFAKIKAMGANTIRRYGMGIYDRNVLNIAEEFKLKVLYGFWFDPKTDFFADAEKVEEYMAEVEEKVLEYKDHPAIVAWSLGNESWGLLKHSYAKPYLIEVRAAYIKMIEHLAQRIHELDPSRPVLSCIEHEEYQLPGELVAFRDGAPSIDVIGINSYYKEQISTLNHVAWQFDSLRPYLVSEFGPSGYWDPNYNYTRNGSLLEQSDAEKANWYKEQWTDYIKAFEGYNVGGFAYCWHDRMEGSYTWFGITDFEGRPKQSYYTLKELWTGKGSKNIPALCISGGKKELIPGHTYTFAVTGANLKNKEIEWRLLKDEYLDEVDNIEELDARGSIALTVPSEPSCYRLYLHVSDKKEQWVTTASLPVKVQPEQTP